MREGRRMSSSNGFNLISTPIMGHTMRQNTIVSTNRKGVNHDEERCETQSQAQSLRQKEKEG
jgi:hypothetical protein